MKFFARLSPFLWFLLFLMTLTRPVAAHPMGNFSINHLARFEARGHTMALRYILDFAEIPTAQRLPQLDTDGNNQVSAGEKAAFLRSEAPTLLRGLSLQIGGRAVTLRAQHTSLELRPGAGGLDTLRVEVDATVPLSLQKVSSSPARVVYADNNFPDRTGWMEIVAVAAPGRSIRDSNAATSDRSHGLTVFPLDAGVVPPRQSSAAFTIASSTGLGAASVKGAASNQTVAPATETRGVPAANAQTPQNRFTQSIAERNITFKASLGGLLVALAFGAVHALSPGHGKTMVAAYLVGTRGTPRHAILLGLVVTITHTLGVFALGFALLFASRYVLPERLFPSLNAASGLLIFGVGLWLLITRWQGLAAGHHASDAHTHSHDDAHDHHHDGHTHEHEHGDDGHHHEGHGVAGHVHAHGGKAHSHAVPEGPVTMKTLVALGISGGIVPCPEALVVLLAAVKLHRIGYGMLLITAFSIGLAAALIGIGLLVVSARRSLSRFEGLSEGGLVTRYLPLGSAALITLIGAALTLRAASGGL